VQEDFSVRSGIEPRTLSLKAFPEFAEIVDFTVKHYAGSSVLVAQGLLSAHRQVYDAEALVAKGDRIVDKCPALVRAAVHQEAHHSPDKRKVGNIASDNAAHQYTASIS
jgi:hypothetical protein